MLFNIISRMIARGNTEGLLDKVDIFFAVGRLSEMEYQALTAALAQDGGES